MQGKFAVRVKVRKVGKEKEKGKNVGKERRGGT